MHLQSWTAPDRKNTLNTSQSVGRLPSLNIKQNKQTKVKKKEKKKTL